MAAGVAPTAACAVNVNGTVLCWGSNNGYLGIGTSTPAMLLDVAGMARASTITTGIASVSSLTLYDNTTPSTGSLYQISSVLYYNNTVIGGVTAANIQAFTF